MKKDEIPSISYDNTEIYTIISTDINATTLTFKSTYSSSTVGDNEETIVLTSGSDSYTYTSFYDFGFITTEDSCTFYGFEFGPNNSSAVYNIEGDDSASELGENILEVLEDVQEYLEELDMGVTLYDLGFKNFS